MCFATDEGIPAQLAPLDAGIPGGSRALAIRFDLRSQAAAFAGLVEALGPIPSDPALGAFNLNVWRYHYLSFWARGTSTAVTFEVGLKDVAGRQTSPKVRVHWNDVEKSTLNGAGSQAIGVEWTRVKIPLDRLREVAVAGNVMGEVDTRALQEINFGFINTATDVNDAELQAYPNCGTALLDSVAFER